MKINLIKGNTYYIETKDSYIPLYKINNREVILLDSGRAKNERKLIYQTLLANDLIVSGILCTHAHVDHVGNNTFLKEKYGAVIAMPEVEAQTCNTLLALKALNYLSNIKTVEHDLGDVLCQTDILITEDQKKIEICNTLFQIIHTPGHSLGHICIITPDNVAYLGDLLLDSNVLKRAKLPYSFCHLVDIHSKKKLHHLKADKYIIAHKGSYDNIDNLIVLNICLIKKKAFEICEILSQEKTLNELMNIMITRFNIRVDTPKKRIIIERNLRPYLDYLFDRKLIKMKYINGDLYYLKK